MPREESLYPADWLRIAEKDLGRARHLLDVQDPEAAGFFLQQATEKFLKAFLLSRVCYALLALSVVSLGYDTKSLPK